jgi:hypothetical protein
MTGVFSNVGQTGQNTLLTYYHNGNAAALSSLTLSRGATSFMNILKVGGKNTGAGSAFISVQDLRIYNTALSAAQVFDIYNQRDVLFSPPKIPVINLPFNGSNVDTINNITNTAGVSDLPIYTSGKFGQGIYLNNATGHTTYVYYHFNNILPTVSKIYIDNGVTMCFWANYKSFPSSAYGTSILYDEFITDLSANLLSIGISSTTTIRGYNQGTFGDYLQPKEITGNFSTGTWYHLAITFSKYACIAYVNGAVGSSNVFVSPVTTGIEYTGLRFGRKTNNNFPNIGFDGSDVIISDARVYNTALTPAQINSIYNQSGVNFVSVTSITNSPGSLMNMLGFAPGTIGYGAIARNLPYLNANEYISLFIENVGVSSNENRQISYKIPTGSIVHQNVKIPYMSFFGGNFLTVTQVLYGSPFASGSYTASSSSVAFGHNASKAFLDPAVPPPPGNYSIWQTNGKYTSAGVYIGSATTTDALSGAVYPGEWAQLQLPVLFVLKSYFIAGTFGGEGNVQLLGSVDGSNWIFIRSSSSQGLGYFQTSVSIPFMYFRFIMQAGATYPGLTCISLTGSVISSPSTIYWAKHNQNTQIIKCPDASLSKLNIKVLDRFGNQITSGSDWSFTLRSVAVKEKVLQ